MAGERPHWLFGNSPWMPHGTGGPNMAAPAAASSSGALTNAGHNGSGAVCGGWPVWSPSNGPVGPWNPLPTSPTVPYPWGNASGYSKVDPSKVAGNDEKKLSPKYVEVADKCSICVTVKKDLKMFNECGHYPFCTDCIRRIARAQGSLRCPECRRSIKKAYPVMRMKPVSAD